MSGHRWIVALFVVLLVSLAVVPATLHACPGCGADAAASSPGLANGFAYATLALIAVPAIAAVAVWGAIRRTLRSAQRAAGERTVTSFHDPSQR